MKKFSLIIFAAIVLTISTVINAMAFSLPYGQDIMLKYNNWDVLAPFPLPPGYITIDPLNPILDPKGGAEFSWGIENVTSISDNSGSDTYWASGQNKEYLSGMWYDLKLGMATLVGPNLNLYLYGGKMDLYLDDNDLAGYTPADPAIGQAGRTGNTFTGFTDSNGTATKFLSLDLAPGVIPSVIDPLSAFGGTTFFVTVYGGNILGTAGGDGFANVTGGTYGGLFDSNGQIGGTDLQLGFHGQAPSKYKYNEGAIPFTADTYDPAYGRTVPEPSSMLLFGMGVFGLASSMLRRKKAA